MAIIYPVLMFDDGSYPYAFRHEDALAWIEPALIEDIDVCFDRRGRLLKVCWDEVSGAAFLRETSAVVSVADQQARTRQAIARWRKEMVGVEDPIEVAVNVFDVEGLSRSRIRKQRRI